MNKCNISPYIYLILSIFFIPYIASADLPEGKLVAQLQQAIQTGNKHKIISLLRNNPQTVQQMQQNYKRIEQEGTEEEAKIARTTSQMFKLILAEINYNKPSNMKLNELYAEIRSVIKTGDIPTAKKKLEAGLKQAQAENDKKYIGIFLTEISGILMGEGQYTEAANRLQQALDNYRGTDDKQGKSGVYLSMSALYFGQGQSDKALDYAQQGLNFATKNNLLFYKGYFHATIGTIYNSMSQYKKALDSLGSAMEAYQYLGGSQAEQLKGEALLDIGLAYQELGQIKKAIDKYLEALTIYKKLNNPLYEGMALTSIGSAYLALDQNKESLKYNLKALKLYDTTPLMKAKVLRELGLIFIKLNKYKEAKKYLNQSITVAKENNSIINKTFSTLFLAGVESHLNETELAIKHYQHGLDDLDKLRESISNKDNKLSFIQNKLSFYDEYIMLLNRLHKDNPNKGYDKKALEIFERKQGRILLEELGKSATSRFAGISSNIRDNEIFLAQNRTSSNLNIDQINRIEKQQEELKQKIKRENPDYYSLKYPEPLNLKQLQASLRSNEILLAYGVMDSDTLLWIISQNNFKQVSLGKTKSEIADQVEAIRQSPQLLVDKINEIAPRPIIRQEANKNLKQYQVASHNLYQILFPEEVQSILKQEQHLYIIPTESLYGLPFGALVTQLNNQKAHYLLEDHPIAYLSSASLLNNLRKSKSTNNKRQPLLAFANPEYPENCDKKIITNKNIIKIMGSNQICINKENELLETEDAAKAIAKLLNADEKQALQLHDKASRSNLFAFNAYNNKDDDHKLLNYKYLLFAAHAVIPEKTNSITQPSIILANPQTEGLLTMSDVFQLKMDADFVLLSACNTGRGKLVRGEGVMGLTRAFLYAGTEAVSVTLWSVESESAKEISISIFKYLKQGEPLIQAIRHSKLDILKSGREDSTRSEFKHPYFWSPFVIFGNGQ